MTQCTLVHRWLAAVGLLAVGFTAQAQWVTQPCELRTGWNAVYLHVDASYDLIDRLAGPEAATPVPIDEIWLWLPHPATLQFVTSPQQPLEGGSRWVNWRRSASGSAQPLQRLVGNAAYLVLASTNATWQVKGRPVPPNYEWTTSGLNLFGFPTVRTNAPSFESFLGPAAALQQSAEIYRYPGGPFGSTNPARVFAFRTTPVRRGEAFWLRAGELYNRYYGPFELVSAGPGGVDFQDQLGTASVRLRNLTAQALTVTMQLDASESPPDGQPALAGPPPLLVRGRLNATNLTYSYTHLTVGGSQSWALSGAGQAGSELEVVLGLHRAALHRNPGDRLAGVLRFTDSLGHAQVEVPVTAVAASDAGLWVGAASVSQVRAYLKSFQKDADGQPVIGPNHAYVVAGVSTNLGGTARPFPLRLIVHTDDTNAHLLQRVYYGLSPRTNFINATREEFLDPGQLASARRITAIHLPATRTNAFWAMAGALRVGTNLTATVTLAHDAQPSNPFLHTYHPDHDNLDAEFRQNLAPGFESYGLTRVIRLTLTPPADDFGSLTRSGQTFGGRYEEVVTLAGKEANARSFEAQGTFRLNRLNRIGTLTTE